MKTSICKMIGLTFLIAFLTSGCSHKDKEKEQCKIELTGSKPIPVPHDVEEAIKKEFPGAMPYGIAIDTLLRHLSKAGITPNQILWGQSTCVDDIINTKNKLVHPEIKGPFVIGGLGGIPFTGITGIDAFSHHVPVDGTALLFVGPHIGYKEKEGWGKILRPGQHHSSSCCGALYSALKKLQKGEIKPQAPSEDDYQQQVIEHLALNHQKEILNAKEPLVELTRVVLYEAEHRIVKYTKRVNERHFSYAVAVVGVIINTDYRYDDYLWIERISIKDIKKNVWIKIK